MDSELQSAIFRTSTVALLHCRSWYCSSCWVSREYVSVNSSFTNGGLYPLCYLLSRYWLVWFDIGDKQPCVPFGSCLRAGCSQLELSQIWVRPGGAVSEPGAASWSCLRAGCGQLELSQSRVQPVGAVSEPCAASWSCLRAGCSQLELSQSRVRPVGAVSSIPSCCKVMSKSVRCMVQGDTSRSWSSKRSLAEPGAASWSCLRAGCGQLELSQSRVQPVGAVSKPGAASWSCLRAGCSQLELSQSRVRPVGAVSEPGAASWSCLRAGCSQLELSQSRVQPVGAVSEPGAASWSCLRAGRGQLELSPLYLAAVK